MRKLLMLAVAGLAALAVIAQSAYAHPDFPPTGDANPTHWDETFATRYDYDLMYQGSNECWIWSVVNEGGEESCPIPTPAASEDWEARFSGSGSLGDCELEVEGSVGHSGFSITDAEIGGSSCSFMEPANLPWEGQICGYDNDEVLDEFGNHAVEYWIRQEMSFDLGPLGVTTSGVSFGKFEDVSYLGWGYFSALTFDDAYIGPVPGYGVDMSHDGTLDLSGGTAGNKGLELITREIYANDNEEYPCSWPELQA